MNKNIMKMLILFVITLVCSSPAWGGYMLIMNPTTGKLDYVSDGNFTSSSTFINMTVSNTATMLNLILTNLESNVDATGYNITADNFVGTISTANSSSYWDNLDDPTEITALGTVASATSITTTEAIVTNLQATNLEASMDATGYDITAQNFIGNVTAVNITTEYISVDNLDSNMDATGYNITVDCILFTSGGSICSA